MNLYSDIELNIHHLESEFIDCGDIVKRKIPIGKDSNGLAISHIYVSYIDMLVDRRIIELSILGKIMPLMNNISIKKDMVFDEIKDIGMNTVEIKEEENFENIFSAMLSGDAVIFIDGFSKAVVVSTKGFPNRGVPSTETEVVVQGSKEAFSEVFRINTALIRRRIRDTKLKIKQVKVGRRSQTDVALMYLDGIVRPAILNDAIERIQSIDIDAVLDSGQVEQLIEDDWKSPFPQIQATERPDKAAAAILDGRIAIIVDNSPFALIIPATFNMFFQSPEDYYQRFHIMSLTRILRYIAGFIAISLPGLYIALTAFHPSMIPMVLALKMAGSRQMIPFPIVVEVLIMELAFELLREAGIRLPDPIGSSIGIVGGIIVGQAAVEAGLVSPGVVIAVALTGIASFTIPHFTLVTGFRVMKYFIIFFSAILGLFGLWIALIFILIHLISLKSFGIPYMFPFSAGDINNDNDLKDTLFRLPLFMLKKRPFFANSSNRVKLNTDKKKKKE